MLSPTEPMTYTHFCILHSKKVSHRLQLKIYFAPRAAIARAAVAHTALPHATVARTAP
jgi:hypothetical protein